MRFEDMYCKVKGIVHKARKDYYIKLWEREDWDQEGMLILHQLLESHPFLLENDQELYRYFKVKFRNHIKDLVRKQESQKRKFDRMSYEDIHDLSHMIGSPGLLNDELILLRDRLREYRSQLSPTQEEQYNQLISGRSFKGRRQMLRELEIHLSDFRGY
ncbi:TPA: sigma-70 family RNA polymerase sigma factor [Streptococcus suis]